MDSPEKIIRFYGHNDSGKNLYTCVRPTFHDGSPRECFSLEMHIISSELLNSSCFPLRKYLDLIVDDIGFMLNGSRSISKSVCISSISSFSPKISNFHFLPFTGRIWQCRRSPGFARDDGKRWTLNPGGKGCSKQDLEDLHSRQTDEETQIHRVDQQRVRILKFSHFLGHNH